MEGVNIQLENIKDGDLFQLGTHKLICGDSLNKNTYKTLIQKDKIDLIITDPPYNVNYNDKNQYLNKLDKGNRCQRPILNDTNINENFFNKLYPNWKNYLNKYNSIYIFTVDISIPLMLNPYIQNGYTFNNILTWLKNNHVLSRTDYNKKTEKIIYGWYGKHKFYGGFNTDVLQYPKPLKNKLHPTMKPIKLIGKLINNSTQKNMYILDCFGGSGTTLLASELLNRKCYMIEKDPHYCNIIIKRWEHLTKQKAKKIN